MGRARRIETVRQSGGCELGCTHGSDEIADLGGVLDALGHLDAGRVGWSMYPLDGDAMRAAAALLVGQHDFSSFRASACQARSPVKTLRRIAITQHDASPDGERCHWHFEFEADAFLHHMIRNLMGCLVRIGRGDERPEWIAEVLAARSRKVAAPTLAADGLYFVGPLYDAAWGLPPESTWQARDAAYDRSP